jgi:hypothetical protein
VLFQTRRIVREVSSNNPQLARYTPTDIASTFQLLCTWNRSIKCDVFVAALYEPKISPILAMQKILHNRSHITQRILYLLFDHFHRVVLNGYDKKKIGKILVDMLMMVEQNEKAETCLLMMCSHFDQIFLPQQLFTTVVLYDKRGSSLRDVTIFCEESDDKV